MIADPHQMGNPDAFDDLADLFLGEQATVHAHDAAVGAQPMPRAADKAGTRDRGPITPAERSPSSPRLTLVSDRPVPALSALSPEGARAPGREPPCIEAIILGHLPVMASAWAAQYVRHIADRIQGPVAMVRINPDGVRLELHFPVGCRPELYVGSDFQTALRNIHGTARRIIVMAPSGRELEAVSAPGVSRITLLTSGDEAGIVAAYGIIKSVVHRLRDARGVDPSSVLRVAVMGASPPRAEAVTTRLRDAAKAFLGLPLQSEVCISRVSPGYPGQALFEGRLETSIENLVAMVGLGPAGEDRSAGSVSSATTTPMSNPTSSPMSKPLQPIQAAAAHPPAVLAPEPAEPLPKPSPASPVADTADMKTASPKAAPRAEASSPSGALSGFIDGLQLLTARSPYAEEVELAIDDDGRLHALCRAEHFGQRGRALERLTIAAEWARAHRQVLALTLGDAPPEFSSEPPLMHLFTDQPGSWRRLLDSPVRIHALAPVTPSHDPHWACVQVN